MSRCPLRHAWLAYRLAALSCLAPLLATAAEPRPPRAPAAPASPSSAPTACVRGWGTSIDLDRAFYAVDGTAEATLSLWNYTPDDVFLTTAVVGPDPGCRTAIVVYDAFDRVVRQDSSAICLPATGTLAVRAGTLVEDRFTVPLRHLNAVTGAADGTPLAPGVYRAVGTWRASGPLRAPDLSLSTGYPEAAVTLRVE